jgi:glycosyltransferase involved in cell wall biosynthesis
MRPILTQGKIMKLSIIICAYNEKESILPVLERVRAADLGPGRDKEIIVVDNFSTDGTRELLQEVAQREDRSVQVVFHPRNLGKGTSIRSGYARATGRYAVIQDADFEYDPADLKLLLDKAEADGADAVFGSRTLGGEVAYKYVQNYWGNMLVTWAINRLFGGRLTDAATATKLIRTAVIPALNLKGTHFDLDFELPCKLLKYGYRIDEVPVSYRPRTAAEGKKIRPWDGLHALWVILKYRFLD